MSSTAIDRRRALLGGAAAGAALWVAPQVRSVAAAQACSEVCTAALVDLLTAPFGAGVNFGDNVPRVVNGTTVRATRSNSDTITNGPPLIVGNPAVPATNGVILNTTVGGISGGQVPLLEVGTTNAPIVLTINFNPGVRNLSFVLTDIDSARVSPTGSALNPTAAYQEQVTIAWTGTAVPAYTYIAPQPQGAGAYQAGGLVPVPSLPTNTYEAPYLGRYAIAGDGNVPVSSSAGNLGVQFDNCSLITQVVITSSDIDPILGTDGNQGRLVGLTSLSWCV